MSANNKELVFQQKRKMFLLMPVIIVPLLALLFSILGGGSAKAEENKGNKGINTDFPSGTIKETDANKMALQAEAKRDENELMRTDFDLTSLQVSQNNDTIVKNRPALNADKMKQINAAYEGLYAGGQEKPQSELYNNAPVQQRPAVQRTVRSASPYSGGSGYSAPERKSNFSYADEPKVTSGNATQQTQQRQHSGKSLIRAVVHGDQTIKSGSLVKLRTLEDVDLGDVVVPKNTLVYGQANSGGSERLTIQINSLTVGGSIYEVQWAVYDLDGNEGINVPSYGRDRKDVQNQTVQDGANEVQNSATGVIGNNQAAQSGNRVLGNLFRNKTTKRNAPKVLFNSGYQVIIKTEK